MSLPSVTPSERLARLGVAVRALGVRQRADLVEAVEVRPRHPARVALVEVAAQADVPVGQREQRLALGQEREVELGLAQDPGLDRERGVLDHPPRRRRRAAPRGRGRRCPRRGPSGRPRGRRGRRRRRSRSRRPGRPRRPRPRPRTPRPRAASTPSRRAPARNVSGAGLPRRRSRLATTPSMISSNRSSDPGRLEDVAAVGARGDDRPAQAGVAGGLDVADRARVGVDAVALDQREDEVVLAVAEAVDGLGVGRVVGGAVRELIPREARNDRTPS